MEMTLLLDRQSDRLSALGHPARLQIFRLVIVNGELSAGAVQEATGIAASTLSHHLDRLTREGLMKRRRDGRQLFYSPDWSVIRELMSFLLEDCCCGCCNDLISSTSPDLDPSGANETRRKTCEDC